MWDKLDLEIPFDSLHVTNTSQGGGNVNILDYDFAIYQEGKIVDGVQVYDSPSAKKWETVASSISHLAVGFYPSGNGFNHWPHVRIKASPNKIIQGHNVFGTEDIKQGALQMLTQLRMAFPKIFRHLDIKAAQIRYLDATYSAVVESAFQRRTIFKVFANLADSRTSVNDKHEDYLQLGGAANGKEASKFKRQKIYYKFQEVMHDLRQAKRVNDKYRVDILSDQRLLDFANSRMRFEGTIGFQELKRVGIPTNLNEFMKFQDWHLETHGVTLCEYVWRLCFDKLFSQIEGHTMKNVDDEHIKLKIDAKYIRIKDNGKMCKRKADAVFKTYKAIKYEGYSELVKQDNKTFFRNVKFLVDAGISKAFLKSLDPMKPHLNVVPIVQLIKIDFSNQRPAWYQEPKASYSQQHHLRLVG